MSIENYSNAIGNRTRDAPACSIVPQPNAPPRAPADKGIFIILKSILFIPQVFFFFSTQIYPSGRVS